MKKSNLVLLFVFIICIPATLLLGSKLPGKGYYLVAVLLLIELLIPFLVAFERRKPQARELVLLSVLCVLAVIGRLAIPLPNFRAIFAIIMISGIALGAENGFMVGAVSALVSNFFFGQGAYLPWQMMAYGAGGMAAGFAFAKNRLPRKRWVMALFGLGITILWVGPLLDSTLLFLGVPEINGTVLWATLAAGFPVNVSQGIGTAVFLAILGNPLLEKIERIQKKYGMLEG